MKRRRRLLFFLFHIVMNPDERNPELNVKLFRLVLSTFYSPALRSLWTAQKSVIFFLHEWNVFKSLILLNSQQWRRSCLKFFFFFFRSKQGKVNTSRLLVH